MTNPISSYMSLIGQKGGKSGTGKSKKRGDKEYYQRIAKLKRKKLTKNNS